MAKDVEYNYTASDKTGPANESVRRRMKETGEKGGKDLGEQAGKGYERGMKAAIPGVKQLLVASAAGASPLIAAAVSGGVIAGVGAAAVGAGVLLASKDARVQSAGKALGATIMSGLTESAEPFIEPVLRNIDKIGDRFDKLRPRLDRIFSNSSKFLDPLTDGLLNGLDGIVRGIDVTVQKGKPAIDGLAYTFDHLGNSAGNALEIIAGGSEGAGSGLEALADVGGVALETVAWAVRGLSEVFELADRRGQELHQQLVDMGLVTDDVGTIARHTATETGAFADQIESVRLKSLGAEGPIITLSDQINTLAKSSRDAFDAQTSVGAAMDAASAAAKKNGDTLSIHTEKGRANRQALSQLRDALINVYNSQVALNGQGPKTDAVAASNREKFIQVARSMGQSKTAAQQLATQMGLIPVKKSIRIDTNSPQARKALRDIQSAINAIHGKSVEVRVFYSKQGEVLYGSGGGRQASQFDAGTGYAVRAAGDGVYRAAPARPVQLDSSVNVFLDGAPFAALTDRRVTAATDRLAWRQKVGRR